MQSLDYHHRGVWFELLLLMNESEDRGRLVLNGKPIPDAALARLLGLTLDETKAAINVLLDYGVASRECLTCGTWHDAADPDQKCERWKPGALVNRRMLRDESLRKVRAAGGLLGGAASWRDGLHWRQQKELKEWQEHQAAALSAEHAAHQLPLAPPIRVDHTVDLPIDHPVDHDYPSDFTPEGYPLKNQRSPLTIPLTSVLTPSVSASTSVEQVNVSEEVSLSLEEVNIEGMRSKEKGVCPSEILDVVSTNGNVPRSDLKSEPVSRSKSATRAGSESGDVQSPEHIAESFRLVQQDILGTTPADFTGPTWIRDDWKPTQEQTSRLEAMCILLWDDIPIAEIQQHIELLLGEFKLYWQDMRDADTLQGMRKGLKKDWYMTFRQRIRVLGDNHQRWLRQQRAREQRGMTNDVKNNTAADRRARLDAEADELVRGLRGGSN